jgi:hypothetical protein
MSIVLICYDVSIVKISRSQSGLFVWRIQSVADVTVSKKHGDRRIVWYVVYVEHVNIGLERREKWLN